MTFLSSISVLALALKKELVQKNQKKLVSRCLTDYVHNSLLSYSFRISCLSVSRVGI